MQNLTTHRMLQLAPSIDQQISAMIALLARYKWNKVAVVTSGIAGWKHFQSAWKRRSQDSINDEKLSGAESSFRYFILMFHGFFEKPLHMFDDNGSG
jgi:hypothetical protein